MAEAPLRERVERCAEALAPLRARLEQVVVGQRELLRALVLGLLADGHVLLEGLPGLAKTLSVRTLARALDARFSRIQFTPDLLPSDVLGSLVYTPEHGFSLRRGPVFAHVVLADEINRAPAKVQSALLEAMEERQVTIGEQTLPLPDPFIVLATRNPIEHEGTYPLPEAQIDRFLMQVRLAYPDAREEKQILRLGAGRAVSLVPQQPVLAPEAIVEARETAREIRIDEAIEDYIVALVRATRPPHPPAVQQVLGGRIAFGASPRATLGLAAAARAAALLEHRAFVLPDDVQQVARWVLPHRLVLDYAAVAEGIDAETLVQALLERLPLP
ncbi:MAG: ATPase [Planctomycetota bacterium]|nr:MAG: ATPase [Planctomycetota bacterium]